MTSVEIFPPRARDSYCSTSDRSSSRWALPERDAVLQGAKESVSKWLLSRTQFHAANPQIHEACVFSEPGVMAIVPFIHALPFSLRTRLIPLSRAGCLLFRLGKKVQKTFGTAPTLSAGKCAGKNSPKYFAFLGSSQNWRKSTGPGSSRRTVHPTASNSRHNRRGKWPFRWTKPSVQGKVYGTPGGSKNAAVALFQSYFESLFSMGIISVTAFPRFPSQDGPSGSQSR